MTKIKNILNEVLKEMRSDNAYEREIFTHINGILNKLNKGQKNIKAVLGGSGAKGTWLKTFDADIFVLFDYNSYKDKSDKLSDALEKILKKKNKNIVRIHGSRDYFQIRKGKFTFEIIPILNIKKADQSSNLTDVSPLHTRWVLKRRKLADDMKLAKQFCQAQNVYGAESYIKGFSGYVCEILTVYYGSFLNLLKYASKWKDKTVIDVEKYHKGKDVFKNVNVSKLVSPLIVIDPVQQDRNAAASLRYEKFEAFKKSAQEFLRSPSKNFFYKKEIEKLFLEEKTGHNTKLIKTTARPLIGKTDVIGTKLLKIYEYFKNELNKNCFKITKSDWEWNKGSDAVFYFSFDKKPLPKDIEIEGPPVNLQNHVENFKKIHKKNFEKNSKIFATEQRKYIVPEDFMKDIIKNEYVRGKCKLIKIESL